MSKYTPGKIAKAIAAGVTAAIGAAAVAAGGPDLSSLSLAEIAGAVGSGLIAFGATFGTPNASDPAPEVTAPEIVQALINKKVDAESQIDLIKSAVGVAVSDVPVLGPLAKELLS